MAPCTLDWRAHVSSFLGSYNDAKVHYFGKLLRLWDELVGLLGEVLLRLEDFSGHILDGKRMLNGFRWLFGERAVGAAG